MQLALPKKPVAESLMILYASQTGTVKKLASQLAADLAQEHIPVVLKDISGVDPATIPLAKNIVYMTSTFFDGKHPKSASDFVAWLRKMDGEKRPVLSNTSYLVFGIGSHRYKTFCSASKYVDEVLERLGARRLGPGFFTDKDSLKKDDASYLIWKDSLKKIFGTATLSDEQKRLQSLLVSAVTPSIPPFPLQNDLQWGRLIGSQTLSVPGNDNIIHKYTIEAINDTDNHLYTAGGHCSIVPRNSPSIIKRMLRSQQIYIDNDPKRPASGNEVITFSLSPNTTQPLNHHIIPGIPYTVRHLLEYMCDFTGPVEPQILRDLYPYFSDSKESNDIQHLLSNNDDFKKKFVDSRLSIYDIFDMYRSIKIPITSLLDIVPPSSARLYSIASAPEYAGRNRIELIITDVAYEITKDTLHNVGSSALSKDLRRGVTTDYLSNLLPGDVVPFTVMDSPLSCSVDQEYSDNPTIAIALGTGIAPFRGRLQHRAALQKLFPDRPLAPYHLFVGLRRASDCQSLVEELKDFALCGTANVHIAFSREHKASELLTFRKSLSSPAGSIAFTPTQVDSSHVTSAATVYTADYKVHIGDIFKKYSKNIGHALLKYPYCTITYCGKSGSVLDDIQRHLITCMIGCGSSKDAAEQRWNELQENGHVILEAW